ncbi:ABC transporter permease subunit [Cohnella sp. AR92]|uniref:ABC transporter permease subunit n=1 Tax=Cohnella sp. AR92 TaxID=648716 RepID=UPI000F8D4240|nr:ABC transporter permease subunit [Cohnella sp. AR92]RUS47996.1 hypothetical protein ELR57_05530 [Cohnella sp. AR92]
MDIGQFSFLLRHELRLVTRRWTLRSWYWMYLAGLTILALVALTIWGGTDQFKSDYLLFACFAFPFFFCMIAFRALKREWSDGTLGWWLTLPYSRSKLLLAKFAASLAQSLAIAVLFFVALAVFEAYDVLLHGLSIDLLRRFVTQESEYFLLLLISSPFMLALGLMMAAMGKSKLKMLKPLVWIAFGLLGNLFNWVNGAVGSQTDGSLNLFDGHSAAWVWLSLPVAWIFAGLIFAGAVGICKKHLVL